MQKEPGRTLKVLAVFCSAIGVTMAAAVPSEAAVALAPGNGSDCSMHNLCLWTGLSYGGTLIYNGPPATNGEEKDMFSARSAWNKSTQGQYVYGDTYCADVGHRWYLNPHYGPDDMHARKADLRNLSSTGGHCVLHS